MEALHSDSIIVCSMDTSSVSQAPVGVTVPNEADVNQYTVEFYMKLVYCLFGTVGVVGNFLVAMVMLYHKQIRQKVTNMLIINQSLIDLTASTLIITQNLIDDVRLVPLGLASELFCRLVSVMIFI